MEYFAGWDVGGWNCENNPASRDALAVLAMVDGTLSLIGKVFRGNIRKQINRHDTLAAILNECCGTSIDSSDPVTIAIDTPLGLPKALTDLVQLRTFQKEMPESYSANPYLYRQTELWLFGKNFSPLSAIKDMIGSQATKGMHLLAKLGLETSDAQCGVWAAGNITALETYPTPVMTSSILKARYESLETLLAEPRRQNSCRLLCVVGIHVFRQER